MLLCPWLPSLSLVLICFTARVSGTSGCRRIDDELGDSETGIRPRYFPTERWFQGVTSSQVNERLASEGTWHGLLGGTEAGAGFDFDFFGTAISVHAILPNPVNRDTAPRYSLQFHLDGVKLPLEFTYTSDSTNNFHYNVSVFSIDGLPNVNHYFAVLASSTDPDSSILFDYAMYWNAPSPSGYLERNVNNTTSSFEDHHIATLTRREDADQSNNSNNLPVIIGATVGGVVVGLAVALGIWYHLRWRRRKRLTARRVNKPPSSFTIDPFILDPSRPTIPRYSDFSTLRPSASTPMLTSQGAPRSNTTSSSGGGSGRLYSGPNSQASSSPPMLHQSASAGNLSRGSNLPHSQTSDPSSAGSPTSPQSANKSRRSSPSRRRRRRERREQIAEMRREVAALRAQHDEMLARMGEQQASTSNNHNHNHDQEHELPEYSR